MDRQSQASLERGAFAMSPLTCAYLGPSARGQADGRQLVGSPRSQSSYNNGDSIVKRTLQEISSAARRSPQPSPRTSTLQRERCAARSGLLGLSDALFLPAKRQVKPERPAVVQRIGDHPEGRRCHLLARFGELRVVERVQGVSAELQGRLPLDRPALR